MADGSATPARVTRREGWTREGDLWTRQHGTLRLVVYKRGSAFGWRWRWIVRGPDYDNFRRAATARDAKAAALEVAARLTAEMPRG